MRPVGILGGMGPQATLLLMQKVIEAVPASDDRDHIPLIVDQNPQVPSRIDWLIEGRGEDPGPVLARMAQRLEKAGAQALAMPCNSAHHFLCSIRAASRLPFIDMLSLSVQRAQSLAPSEKQIGILASPAVRRAGVLEEQLADAGLRAVYPAREEVLLAAIRRIKADGPSPEVGAVLRGLSADLAKRGAGIQLVACTEFSLLPEPGAPDVVMLDTLDLLVEGILDFALEAGAQQRPLRPDLAPSIPTG